MELNPHLSFDGQCEAAFKFYEKCLGGKIAFMMTYAESPMAEQAPPGFGSKIMHATFALDGQRFYGGDAPPGQYAKPQGFTVALGIKDPAEADRVFAALAESGVVQMPIQETFWALRFGAVVDQFGTPWMVNCEKPASG